MAYDIGPRIGIDGEAQFRKELGQINATVKTLGAEMKSVTANFGDNEKSMESLTAQNRVLAEQIKAVESQIKKQGEAVELAADKFGEADEKTQKWKRAVYESQAELAKLTRKLEANEKAMDGLGDETENIADDLKDAEKAGLSFGDALKANVLGDAIMSGIGALGSAIGGMVSSLAGLDEATEEYRVAMGKLTTAFESAGHGADVAQDAYQGLYRIIGDTDTATEAAQLMSSLASNSAEMANWVDIAAGVYGTFGDALPIEGLIEAINETVKVGAVTGSLADALNWAGIEEEAFGEALESMASEAERNNYIMQTLASTYSNAADAFYASNEQLVASRDVQAQLDAMLGKLGGTIAGVKTELTRGFLPALTTMAGGLDGLLSGQLDFSGFANALSTGVKEALAAVRGLLPIEGKNLVVSLALGLEENLPTMISSGLSMVTELSGSLRKNVGLMVDGAVQLAQSFARGIADSIPAIIKNAPLIVSNLANTINDNAPKILAAAGNIMITLGQGLLRAIPALIQNIPSIIKAIVDVILAFNWLNLGKSIITGLGNGIKSMGSFAKDSAGKVIATIKDSFKNLPSTFADIGKNMIQGLWSGIQNMVGWIQSKIKNFVGGIVSTVTSTLGIHSPSRVFAGIGGYMAEGLEQGFERKMGAVERNISRSMSTLATNATQSATAPVGVQSAASSPAAGQTDLAGAMREAMSGMGIYLNNRKVGQMLTDYQNNTTRAQGVPVTL